MEAWRWRLGAGGLALEAWRWRLGAGGLVARRRASPCSWRGASGACRSWRGVAQEWHVAWRVSAVQALGAAGLKRGAGLTLKMKTRVGPGCW